jgi:rhomboid protease GluP
MNGPVEGPDLDAGRVTVFRGSRAACYEFALVLEAKSLAHELIEQAGDWTLTVSPSAAKTASEELDRYSAERSTKPEVPKAREPFAGAALGAMGYTLILLLAAYCAGADMFSADWFAAGDVEARSGAGFEWWRAVTALTLHVDPAHLLDNLLFGVGIGVLAGRMFGPGLAWLSILVTGALGNYLEMLIAPASHRAVGASTAVFAALGLLAGYAWRQRLNLRERWMYRWTPLIAGVCLLALLGAGTPHVDVLGHLLGFLSGIALGFVYARTGVPRSRSMGVQIATGGAAVLLVVVAWALALQNAGA